MKTRTIEIDLDVHRAIEESREAFEESENTILKRLLSLVERPTEDIKSRVEANGIPFSEKGVQIEHGSPARMFYERRSQCYEGVFENGYLIVSGKKYSSLSSAASDLAVTKDGGKTNLNGWNYWEVKPPQSGQWIRVRDLRNDGQEWMRHFKL